MAKKKTGFSRRRLDAYLFFFHHGHQAFLLWSETSAGVFFVVVLLTIISALMCVFPPVLRHHCTFIIPTNLPWRGFKTPPKNDGTPDVYLTFR